MLRLACRAMLVISGVLLVDPTFMTDVAALVLISAQSMIERGVLAKAKPIVQ